MVPRQYDAWHLVTVTSTTNFTSLSKLVNARLATLSSVILTGKSVEGVRLTPAVDLLVKDGITGEDFTIPADAAKDFIAANVFDNIRVKNAGAVEVELFLCTR